MKLDSISYDELAKLLNFNDLAEFRRRLRALNYQIPTGKAVPRKQADEIASRFTGKALPWNELERAQRTIDRASRLNKFCSPEAIQSIGRWYQKIDHSNIQPNSETFLGLVCEGGFLEGADDPEFIISFKPGANILIGERGSGKSTILNLLGLLANSVGVETKGLVQKLLNILNPEVEDSYDELTHTIERATETLRFYGINKYANYYTVDGDVYCFYIDLMGGCFELLGLRQTDWIPIDRDKFVKPAILFFEQGEVVRIAEDREKNYYLNSIMDAVYPDLYHLRTGLTQSARALDAQYRNFMPNYLNYNSWMADRFINERYRELKSILRELDDGYFNPYHVDIIQNYLDQYNRFTQGHPEIRQKESILRLLQSGEDALNFLYIGRICWFLERDLKRIRSLISRIQAQVSPNPDSQDVIPPKFTGKSSQGDPDFPSADVAEALQEIEILKEISDEDFTKEFEDNEPKTAISEEKEIETPLLPTESQEEASEFTQSLDESKKAYSQNKLKLKTSEGTWSPSYADTDRQALLNLRHALKDKEKTPLAEELLGTARDMSVLLRTRLRYLRKWNELYLHKNIVYDKPLYSLVDRYVGLLDQRNNLIGKQVAYCQEMTQTLKLDENDIRVYTLGAGDTLKQSQVQIGKLMELSGTYEWIIHASPITKLRDLEDRFETYDKTTQLLFDDLEEFKSNQINPDEHAMIFNPIGIDLRQGNIYRSFRQLSFGQKSGIILKMVLSTTEKKLVVIDQPEDNLDAFSITNMLSSTLGRIGKNRQVILVTHNSNLVIGLEDSTLLILKSWGEKSRLNMSGSSKERALIEAMIDVLEGGKETFDRKLMSYGRFIESVMGQIPDINFAFVESSYRRRTIDGLSNYLQPIVSDRAAMASAYHELKQLDAARLRMEIRQLRSHMNTSSPDTEPEKETIVARLDQLTSTLDAHIVRFLRTINEIRMMDTNPRPEYIHLYELLLKLQAEYTERLQEGERRLQFFLDPRINEIRVWADQNHIRLIFRNLIENALRSTELRVIDGELAGWKEQAAEIISIELDTFSEDYIQLIFSDNGRGMPAEIKTMIYKERCSDQVGTEHGLGAVIISKLLGMNHGSIEVIESHTIGNKMGTVQQITLSSRKDEKYT